MYMNWRKWLDEFVLAGKGVLLAAKKKRFWYGFVPSFIFFGMLINLLSGGTVKFELMAALGFPESLKILGDAFLSIFGVRQPFLDLLPTFFISLLQGTLIGLIIFLWDKKRDKSAKNSNTSKKSDNPEKFDNASANSDNLQKAGIITGLIALGAGCPTCGVSLLTPLIGAIFSTGGLAIAGAVSSILTVLAVIIAILSLKRLGEEVYVIIINEKYLKKVKKE